MDRLLECPAKPKEMSTAALAFVGDAVYSLMVREWLSCSGRWNADTLHKRAVGLVRCEAQSLGLEKIFDCLQPDELAVYTRGRNMHTAHMPKNATTKDYRSATGVETLFGWLYLSEKQERLREVFNAMMTALDTEPKQEGK